MYNHLADYPVNDDGQTCIKSMHFWNNVLYYMYIQRSVAYFVKYGKYDFGKVKIY